MIRSLAVAVGLSVLPVAGHVDAAGAACGPVTYTWGTKYPTCDLQPPDVLHVYAVNRSTCLNWGGVWAGEVKLKQAPWYTTLCRYVDY